MRRLLLLSVAILSLMGLETKAQIIDTRISDIQTVTQADLAACVDTPRFVGKKVRVRGVVINPGGIAQTQSVGNRQLWIRESSAYGGPFTAIGLRATANAATVPVDMLSLEPGDSVEIVGTVGEFMGSQDAETQINISPNAPDQVTLLGATTAPKPHLISAADIQDANRLNKLTTGEQYEGEYVALRNMTVASVETFTSGGETRVSFWVRDAQGNQVNITDRFAVQRPRNGFVAPNVGDFLDTIKGVIIHNRNGCPGSPATNRGYQISPWQTTDYRFGNSAPGISGIVRNPTCPRATDAIVITASISNGFSSGGTLPTITSVTLNWTTGTTGGSYTAIPMTQVPATNNWTATIPAQPNNTFVRYYISATNSINLTNHSPDVPGNQAPTFLTVNDNGCTIRDIQYTPYVTGSGSGANGISGYRGLTLTLEGVVTADTSDGPNVYIQQEGALSWGGIMVRNLNNQLSSLRRGEKVSVTGTITEFNQMTQIDNVTAVSTIGTGTITPLVISPSDAATWSVASNEQYEGMLIEVRENATTKLSVIDTNYLITPAPNRNFGEWRVGYDQTDSRNGVLVLTGARGTASKKVTYLNNLGRFRANIIGSPVLVDYNTRFDAVRGIMFHSFGDLKLIPRDNQDFVNVTTDLAGVFAGKHLNLFPNPASGSVNIAGADLNGGTATILNISGQVVRNVNITNSSVELNGLNAGIYMVRLVNAAGQPQGVHKLAVR